VRVPIGCQPVLTNNPFELNLVWYFGNKGLAHDELTPADLTSKIERFIHNYFLTQNRRTPQQRIVEKTVSNALRLECVHAVFPDCKIIHLIRDGRDVAASARGQWQASMPVASVARKLASFPWVAIPTYGLQYARAYLRRSFAGDGRVETWGPRFRGIDAISKKESLLVTCGWQWRRCVESAHLSLAQLPRETWTEVRYEHLVTNGAREIERIYEFCGLPSAHTSLAAGAASVDGANVGKFHEQIQAEEMAELMAVIGITLQQLGYAEGQPAS
jgi:hypothetical protein